MSYNKPPILATDSIAIDVVAVSQTLVAASALAAYRIYAISVGVNRSATGFTDVRVRIGGQTILYASGMQRGQIAHCHAEYPFPGIMRSANQAITWDTDSTVAAGTAFCYVWYYVDPYTP